MTVKDRLLQNYVRFLAEIARAGIDFDASEYHAGMEAGLAISARVAGASNEELFEILDDYLTSLQKGGEKG